MTLAAGSVAFVSYAAENAGEGFTFVALATIPAGTTLTFTDRLWNGSEFGRESNLLHGDLTWTAPTERDVPAGTLVSINNISGKASTNVGKVVETGQFNLSFGQSISCVTGSTAIGGHGTFVTVLSVGAPTPLLNTGLTAGTNALVFPQNGANSTEFTNSWDVGCINRATSDAWFANPNVARAAFNNPANWVRDGELNNGAPGDTNNAEGNPLTDANSPLYLKTALSIQAPPLSAGSIAFVAVSADDGQETFAFVLLQDMAFGQEITFNDRTWNGSSYDMSTGGTITWKVPQGGLQAGQVVQINAQLGTGLPSASAGDAAKTGSWDLGSGGALYANDGATGTFLSAIGFPGFFGSNDFLAGTGLTHGANAMVFPSDQQSYFFRETGDVASINRATAEATFASLADARAAYNTLSNWIRDGGVNDGGPGDTSNPEGDPLGDPNSPLGGKTTLPVCFMAGTLIRTPAGEVPIERLSIGDRVVTSEGAVRGVKWIGRQTVSTLFADPVRSLPIRIGAGALADNVPSRDLLVSPDHALLVDGILINAGALVNGTSIVRERDVPMTFTYYHVELSDHSLVLAENAPAETFVDNVERMAFDNWAEHEALYPDAISIPEMSYPRAKSARQVPAAIRQRLVARAALILGATAAQAA